MADRVVVTKTLTAAVAGAVAAAQALAAAGNLLINGTLASGGVATFDTQRRVSILSSGDDSGLTWTIYGTNGAGVAVQEALAGGNAVAVATVNDFKTVTRVASSGAVAGTVQVGTSAVGSSAWQIPNPHITPFELGISLELLSGTATFGIECTDDTLLAPMPVYSSDALPVPSIYTPAGLSGVNANTQGAILGHAPAGWRLVVYAGTGAVQAIGTASGIRN